jgi:thiol:disulfide interchange protein DsbD
MIKELPKKEQYVSKETGKEIVSVGNKWVIFKLQNLRKCTAVLHYIRQ